VPETTLVGSRPRGTVVVGVDGSLEAAEAAQYAASAAEARGADLLVVHAFSFPGGAEPGDHLSAATHGAAQRVADDTLTQVRVPASLRVRTRVEATTPTALLLRLSRDATLVVLGQHAFDLGDQLLVGSVAGPLASAAGCPVVVVPRGWSRAGRRSPVVAVALDGTSSAEPELAFAFAEAERSHAPVVALHAAGADEGRAAAAASTRNLEEILAGGRESHPDLAVSVRRVSGEAAAVVLDASSVVRLMVVGRPHRGPAAWRWRRSVALAVLATASCPLAVVG
jgi:nucleotide-binding universal stress UspA family protein